MIWQDEKIPQWREHLARCLLHVGLDEIAAHAATMKPGEVEALVNAELLRVDFKSDQDRWFALDWAKGVARRIRKPINEFDDYLGTMRTRLEP